MVQSALDYIRTVENLRDVWREFVARSGMKSSAGIDWITPVMFQEDLGRRLKVISDEMSKGYAFSPLRAVVLPKKDKDKTRLICIPTIADRLVQRAILRKIELRSTALGIVNDVSFGFVRPLSGAKRGTSAARQAAIKLRTDHRWVLKADISAFFDTIDRKILIDDFARKFSLRSLQPLIRSAVDCEVRPDSDRVRRSIAENNIRTGVGLRQGMPLSPVLSNFVLRDFDHVVGSQFPMVRYADDMLIFCISQDQCDVARALIEAELAKIGLSLSAAKTKLHKPDDAVEFLGMELCVKSGGTGYQLRVSDSQMRAIRAEFTSRHDWQDARRQKMKVSDLFFHLDQMKRGYLSAYSSADNRGILEEKLTHWTKACANRIYASIFGEDRVSALSPEVREFLMLP
jgi:RNA-directed DNA polymerase